METQSTLIQYTPKDEEELKNIQKDIFQMFAAIRDKYRSSIIRTMPEEKV